LSRKIGIVLSVVLALVFSFLIIHTANNRFEEVTKTIIAARAKQHITAGSEITADMIEEVAVQEAAGKGLISPEEAVGKVARVSMVGGQNIYADALETGKALRTGYVEVFVPVDLASSACAIPGQYVNVHKVNDDGTAPVILKQVRVLHSLDNQGGGTNDGGGTLKLVDSSKPSAIGLEVPEAEAERIVYAASQKDLYLTRSSL